MRKNLSYTFLNSLNRYKCLGMFYQNIVPQLNIAYGNRLNHTWSVQDEAPAHRGLAEKTRLLEIFQNSKIALGCDIEWHLQSLDLIPCQYFSCNF